jgi:hypothetical protein
MELQEKQQVELEVSCNLHFYKIPTSGTLKLYKNYMKFTGIHHDSTEVYKLIHYSDIKKVSQENSYMKQCVSILDSNAQVIHSKIF